jgi:hypothetical protein
MDAGIINVIYMELYSGPKMANGTCGKTIVTGTIDRGSTVYHKIQYMFKFYLQIFTGSMWFPRVMQLMVVWIGRGGTIAWLSQMTDLTPLDFCVWGYVHTKFLFHLFLQV